MTEFETNQPNHGKPMSLNALAKDMGEEYVKGAGKEAAGNAGEQTVDYIQSEDGQQHVDDAKAQAEGFWAKYCGCFAVA